MHQYETLITALHFVWHLYNTAMIASKICSFFPKKNRYSSCIGIFRENSLWMRHQQANTICKLNGHASVQNDNLHSRKTLILHGNRKTFVTQ